MPLTKPFTEIQEKFINMLMRKGKKSIARKLFINARKEIQDKGMKNFDEVFDKAIDNVGPILEVRAKRVGGAVYQIPFEVPEKRRRSLSMRWIINTSKSHKGAPMHISLANELINASNNQGDAVKKKEETHKMAEANKAFAHFARY